MKDDLISRQTAMLHFQRTINACDSDCDYNQGFIDGMEFCLGFIKTLPSAQQWTPVTEGLPKNGDWGDWYWGVFKDSSGWVIPTPFVCYYLGKEACITTKDFWVLKEHIDEQAFDFEYFRNMTCVAWMPMSLPEPYVER